VHLKYYEGLSTDEIALRTGIEKRTVYNQLHEGIKFLRKELSAGAPGIHLSSLLSLLPLL
jgi:RNA polymerase sigma-70 factor (ECF subfamily)